MKQKSGIKQQHENTFNQHAHFIHQMTNHIHNTCNVGLFVPNVRWLGVRAGEQN